ncbi:Uncharacterized protein GBIM_20498 [Gryllus bimaculatus]|nr:Uncharacterized protein GBIM_20498 [Gryllus bimaculatus]
MPLEDMRYVLNECMSVLDTWKNEYYDTRKMIEEKGKAHRWEFDRRKLFRQSEWIKAVCNDLLMIADVLKDFKNIFGVELKSILTDPAQIDAVMDRVYDLLLPIKNSYFDIYDWNNELNWESTMQWFQKEVKILEYQAEYFIASSFKLLRDSDQAIEMLLKFIHIDTRPAIHAELMERLEFVLQHYRKELVDIEDDFWKNKADPPLYRNHPPYSGAIYWSKCLYTILRKPVLVFQTVPEFSGNALRQSVNKDYLEVATELRGYMDKNFKHWLRRAMPIVRDGLERCVLTCVRCKGMIIGICEGSRHANREKTVYESYLKQWHRETMSKLTEYGGAGKEEGGGKGAGKKTSKWAPTHSLGGERK